MPKLSRARRAEIVRSAHRIRQRGQLAGWGVQRIAAAIVDELADVTRMESWRFAYGWTRPQVIDAIAAQYVGDGLAAPPINTSMLCRWEHATLAPSIEYGDALCRLYRVGHDQLGLTTCGFSVGTAATHGCACRSYGDRSARIGAVCQRRYGAEFPTMMADRGDGAAALAAVRESIQLGLEVEGPAGGALTREQLEYAVEYYALSYSAYPPGLLAAEVQRCRALVTGMLALAQPTSARGGLRRLAGWLSALLGNLAFHLADYPAAYIHLGTAARLGAAVADVRLVGWSLGAQSMVARYQHRYSEALDLAHQGLEYATSPLTRAQLMAWAELPALARLGGRYRSEAARLILAAQREMGADPDGEQPGRFGFDLAEFELHVAEAQLVLGDPATAAAHAHASRRHTTLGRPGWAASTLVLAACGAHADRPDQAVDLAITVLDAIAPESLRETVRQRLAVLDRRLLALDRSSPAVRDLNERVRALPPPTGPARTPEAPEGPEDPDGDHHP